jgi:hypothetical protein
MKNILFILALLLNLQAFGQIFPPEGLNIPGQWNQWVNPPANKPAFAGNNQVTNGQVVLNTIGLRRYQTTIHIDSAGADTSAGTYNFLFTSGAAGNPYQNKWGGVNVSIHTIQNYFYGSGTDNSVTLENGKFYTINWQDAGYQNTRAVFLRTSAKPVTIDSARTNLGPAEEAQSMQPVAIVAFLSDTPATDENLYVRWSVDAFASSSIAQLSINGKQASGQIPGLNAGNVVQWYLFSSSISNPPADYDMLSIRSLNNNGLNFSYTIKQQRIAVNLGSDLSICPGSETLLQPDENYDSYLWSTGDTTASILIDSAGVYSIKAMRGAGIGFDTIRVTEFVVPPINLPKDTAFCNEFTFTLDAGPGFSNYSWSQGSDTRSIQVSQGGKFKVMALTSNACMASDSINILQIGNLPDVSLGPDKLLCGNQTIILNPAASVSPAGDSLTIIYDATKGQSQLTGASKVYMHSSFEYLPFGGPESPWTGNWGQDDGIGKMTAIGNNRWKITIKPYGFYNIDPNRIINGLFMVFRDSSGTKTGKDENGNDIFLNLSLAQPTSPFSGVNATRFGSIFSGSNWSTGAKTPGITVSEPGIYSLTLIGPSGCNVSDTIAITAVDTPSVDLGPDRLLCPGEKITLDAGSGFISYSWFGGSSAQTLEVSNPGFYFVTVSNGAGCDGYDFVQVNSRPSPIAGFNYQQGPGPFTINFSNTSQFGETSYWDFNGDGFNDLVQNGDVSNTYSIPGSYAVRLIAENQCGRDTIVQTVLVESNVGMPVQEHPGVIIYPNPAADVLNITSESQFLAEIYSSEGRKIEVLSGNGNSLFSMDKIPSGTYLLRVITAKSVYIQRLVILNHSGK